MIETNDDLILIHVFQALCLLCRNEHVRSDLLREMVRRGTLTLILTFIDSKRHGAIVEALLGCLLTLAVDAKSCDVIKDSCRAVLECSYIDSMGIKINVAGLLLNLAYHGAEPVREALVLGGCLNRLYSLREVIDARSSDLKVNVNHALKELGFSSQDPHAYQAVVDAVTEVGLPLQLAELAIYRLRRAGRSGFNPNEVCVSCLLFLHSRCVIPPLPPARARGLEKIKRGVGLLLGGDAGA